MCNVRSIEKLRIKQHSIAAPERSAQDDSFFSPRSGWRASHTTVNRKAALFFSLFFFPLYFFVWLPAKRRLFLFPASAKEQGPKFRVVVCRSRAFGNAPPLCFSQVVWMFFPPLPRLFWPYSYSGCGATLGWYATTRATDKIRLMRKTQF